MNKSELVDALEERLGGRKQATAAVEALVDTITLAVAKGEKVAISGFGTFEKQARNARTGRNPRTGEAVKIKKTSVPRFRPGTAFKEVVADTKALRAWTASLKEKGVPVGTGAQKPAPAAGRASAATSVRPPARPAAAARPAARTTATGTAARTTAAKTAPARTTAAKTTAAKTTAAKTTAAKTTAAKTTAARTTAGAAKSAAKQTAGRAPAKRAAKKA